MNVKFIDSKFVRLLCSCGCETYIQWSKKCKYPDLTYSEYFQCLDCKKKYYNPRKNYQLNLFEGDI